MKTKTKKFIYVSAVTFALAVVVCGFLHSVHSDKARKYSEWFHSQPLLTQVVVLVRVKAENPHWQVSWHVHGKGNARLQAMLGEFSLNGQETVKFDLVNQPFAKLDRKGRSFLNWARGDEKRLVKWADETLVDNGGWGRDIFDIFEVVVIEGKESPQSSGPFNVYNQKETYKAQGVVLPTDVTIIQADGVSKVNNDFYRGTHLDPRIIEEKPFIPPYQRLIAKTRPKPAKKKDSKKEYIRETWPIPYDRSKPTTEQVVSANIDNQNNVEQRPITKLLTNSEEVEDKELNLRARIEDEIFNMGVQEGNRSKLVLLVVNCAETSSFFYAK